MNKNLMSLMGIVGAVVVALAIATAGAGAEDAVTMLGVQLIIVFGVTAFVVQWLAFIPAFIFQTEKYFDLLGSLTFIVLAAAALAYSNREPGSIAISVMVIVWALRLGSFLFVRVNKVGHDSRFRSIKPDFLQFLMTWTLQGLWVFLTLAAGLTAMTSGKSHGLDVFVIVGCLMWLSGFVIEVIADQQKSAFRQNPLNADQFITQGLWSWSRHPNYFGEILLWVGIAIVAFPVLEGWQYVTLISPVFVVLLLIKISGVRMLEHRARKKWGNDAAYQAYYKQTPMLLLNPTLTAIKP